MSSTTVPTRPKPRIVEPTPSQSSRIRKPEHTPRQRPRISEPAPSQPVVNIDEDDDGDDEPPPEQGRRWYKINELWMTSQMTQYESKEVEVRTTLRELLIYLIFLIILLTAVLGMTSTTMYYYTKVMSELFLDTSTDEGTSFRTATSIHDFWSFAETVMIDNFFWDFWYRHEDPNFKTSDEDKKILYENKLLGLPRLSWVYSTEKELQSSSHWGQVTTYGGGGFYQDLPVTDKLAMIDTVAVLKDNLWITRGTRVVFLDFTVYNANINLFCIVKIVAEIPPTGGMVPSWSFRVVKLIRYVTPFDYFIMACELMVVMFIIFYTIEEVRELCYLKLHYFDSKWNWLDIVILSMAYMCFVFNIYRHVVIKNTLDQLLEHENKYANFDWLGFWQVQYNNAVAVLVFFSWIKIFKYINFNRTMSQLSNTLNRCAKDVAGFTVMFFIVFLAFAQLGYLLFGTQVVDFSTFGVAVFTLLRAILGDFDYEAIERANRILAPIFFLSYIFFVFFVLLNMFLAIINDTYSEVKSEITLKGEDFKITDFLRRGFVNIMHKMGRSMHPKTAGEKLTCEDIRNTLRKCNFTDVEIESFFAKYDLEPNEEIGEAEALKMLSDLEGRRQPGLASLLGRPSTSGAPPVSTSEFDGLRTRVDKHGASHCLCDRQDGLHHCQAGSTHLKGETNSDSCSSVIIRNSIETLLK